MIRKLELIDDNQCFACGMENPHGLRIEWAIDNLTTTAVFTPDQKHQGWRDIVHGGILATLLDEAMTRLACKVYGGALTAEMTVRFVSPAKIGELLTIRGEITKESRKIVEMKASIHSPSGKLIAHSTGKAIKI